MFYFSSVVVVILVCTLRFGAESIQRYKSLPQLAGGTRAYSGRSSRLRVRNPCVECGGLPPLFAARACPCVLQT